MDKADRLPIKIDATSNGEFEPVPDPPPLRRAKAWAVQQISDNARRLGLPRRRFLTSLCGAATTLATFNAAHAARGNGGGRYSLPKEAPFEPAAAAQALAGDEFIFDVQTHMVDPSGPWRRNAGKRFERVLAWWPQGACGEADPTDCYDGAHLIKEVFLDSDTDMAVLSFIPAPPERNPLSLAEADRVRLLVEALGHGRRLLLHGMILPNLAPYADQYAAMAQYADDWPIAAWKTYTQWGPDGVGWALDDPTVGIPFIEQARALGVRNICVHKGLALPSLSRKGVDCADVGRAARLYPDVNFIVYHAGFETTHREGPYDPDRVGRGIDTLVKSLADNGIAANANVYAELGSTWRFLMRDPTAAAHALGKLIAHVGEDNVLWGTDSIWYGSPQDQIQAFRAFEIDEALQDRHGYAALTPARKAKIFGLNGARVYGLAPDEIRRKAETDDMGRLRAAYLTDPQPSFQTYGPRTRRQFLALQKQRGGMPD